MTKSILVFGEDENDRRAIVELVRALRPDLREVKVQTRRSPVVHLKGTDRPATKRSVAEQIAALTKAQSRTGPVIATIAHQDCDAVEPAHEALTRSIEEELARLGVPNPIAAAPAWEIEAWWMLFPDALAAVRNCWRRLPSGATNVGMVVNAKEALQRALRPSGRTRCPDYSESDSVAVAKRAGELGLLRQCDAKRSASYAEFRNKLLTLKA